MSRFKLQVDEGYEFLCFGASCHLKDYKLAWIINNALKIELARQSIVPPSKNGEPMEYALFKYDDQKSHLRYYILNNFSDALPMVKEYKQFNFLILIEGFIDLFDSDSFVHSIQSLDAIQLITPLPKEPMEKFQFELFEE